MRLPNRATSVTLRNSGRDSRRRLVLLADGDHKRRRALSRELTQAGYLVLEVADGTVALEICREREPDLILADFTLERLSGLDLCRAHRALRRQGYGYFILLSPDRRRVDVAGALQAGADELVVRPVAGAELLARIAAAERVLDMQDNLAAANHELQTALERLSQTQEQMNADLRAARRFQQAMLREHQQRFGPFRITLLMRPAGMIGGDFVGFHRLADDTVGIHAVDVSGQGVAAALLTARLSAQIETMAHDLRASVSGLVTALNDMMLDGPQTDAYLTMVYARLDLARGQVRLVQAGHPHPVIQRADGRVEQVGHGGLPVGVVADARYDELEIALDPGDRMLIVSDGITEAVGPRGDMLGSEGLRAILQLNAPLSGHALLESMSWSVSSFASGDKADDRSAVLIEHLPGAAVLPHPGARPDDAPPEPPT
ncbi:PP2C family protein-serine/threonine phosphatase [Paracoccus alkenifer]|uniref:Serine phosphatase RsbU, regulator of sigma subunit n=1 Tax=Paracoccus alkenifer TaxID=65735 RepID=A0A1H6MNR9_9RHOB|nr:response regulator [Paracoccus alkenifer]SEI03490.1 Serine phosphatase RsbU, regulator of sigma subunit [Paracoccus alkenifer]